MFDQKGSLARLILDALDCLSVARTYSAFCLWCFATKQEGSQYGMLYCWSVLKNLIFDYSENSRMKRQSLVLITVALLLMTACQTSTTVSTPSANNNSATTKSTPDQFAAARALYEKNCKLCHGANGEGGPVKLEDGTKLKVPTFREGHALKHPDSDFVKQITKGGDGMPAFGEKLKPEEVNDLVHFIRHEFQGGMMPPGEPMKSPMKGMNMNMK